MHTFTSLENLPELTRRLREDPEPVSPMAATQTRLFPLLSCLGFDPFDPAQVEWTRSEWLAVAGTYLLGYRVAPAELPADGPDLAVSVSAEGMGLLQRQEDGWKTCLTQPAGEWADELLGALSRNGLSAEKLRELAEGTRVAEQVADFLDSQYGEPSRGFLNFLSTTLLKKSLDSASEAQLRAHLPAGLDRFARRHQPPAPEPLETRLLKRVQAILKADLENPRRLAVRVGKTYMSVLLDDNNRRPLCRLYELEKGFSLGLMEGNQEIRREPLESLEVLDLHAQQLAGQLHRFLNVVIVDSADPADSADAQ